MYPLPSAQDIDTSVSISPLLSVSVGKKLDSKETAALVETATNYLYVLFVVGQLYSAC